eukprot:4971443-Amphidinium_carterae.1
MHSYWQSPLQFMSDCPVAGLEMKSGGLTRLQLFDASLGWLAAYRLDLQPLCSGLYTLGLALVCTKLCPLRTSQLMTRDLLIDLEEVSL